MQWLAKQFQNYLAYSDEIADGSGWTVYHNGGLGDSLLLQNGRRMRSFKHLAATQSLSDYFVIATAQAGSFHDKQTFAGEFAIEDSSMFTFNIYDSASGTSHMLYIEANPTTKRLRNFYTSVGSPGIINSYGVFELPYAAENGQPIYLAWFTLQNSASLGNQRNLYFYPQIAESSSSSPVAGAFLGHLQVRDGGLDFTTDPIYGLGPWVVTSGAAVLVGSLEAIMLDTEGPTLGGQKYESKLESQSGKQYRYTWGRRDSVRIPLTMVNCLNTIKINSYWKDESDLVYFDDRNYIVISGTITNRELPLSRHQKPLMDRWRGTINLEGY